MTGSIFSGGKASLRWQQCASWAMSLTALLPGFMALSIWPACFFRAFRVSAGLGSWPSYGHPDPKDLPVALQPGPADLAAQLLFWVAAAAVANALLQSVSTPVRRVVVAAGVSLVLLGLGLLLVWADPGGVAEWTFD